MTEGEHGDPMEDLRRQLAAERGRNEWLLALLSRHGSALARIEQRLTGIESRLGSTLTAWVTSLTPAQWAKVLGGLLLPLAVLLATGNAELARKLVLP